MPIDTVIANTTDQLKLIGYMIPCDGNVVFYILSDQIRPPPKPLLANPCNGSELSVETLTPFETRSRFGFSLKFYLVLSDRYLKETAMLKLIVNNKNPEPPRRTRELDKQKDYLRDILQYMLRNKLISIGQYAKMNGVYLGVRFGSKLSKAKLINSLEIRGLSVIGLNYYFDFKRGLHHLVQLAEGITPELRLLSGGRDESLGIRILRRNMREFDRRKKRAENERAKNFDKYKK